MKPQAVYFQDTIKAKKKKVFQQCFSCSELKYIKEEKQCKTQAKFKGSDSEISLIINLSAEVHIDFAANI